MNRAIWRDGWLPSRASLRRSRPEEMALLKAKEFDKE